MTGRPTLEDGGKENGYTPADDQGFEDVDANPERFADTKKAKIEQEDRGLDSSKERSIDDFDSINDLEKDKNRHCKERRLTFAKVISCAAETAS